MSYERFNYDLPDEILFYKTLLNWLKYKEKSDLVDVLENGKCGFNPTSSFSRKRWNAYSLSIYFYVPMDKFEKISTLDKEDLIDNCNQVIPKENGYDVTFVDFQPLISPSSEETSLMKDLEKTTHSLSSEIVKQFLPDDIKQKGKEMTECYLYLYCVENTIRLFVQNVSKANLGDDYINSLNLNGSIRDRLKTRKSEEALNKWKRIRGDNDLFYLDFKDLSAVIRNNWEVFSKYFPDQSWIETKINELAECRNLIAHNSYLGDHEKDIVRINFNSILKQLEKLP